MQSIGAIISVQVLSVGSCLDHLQSPSAATSEDDAQSYITKLSTVEIISELMFDLAESGFFAAGPAILGWSAIMATIQRRIMASKTTSEDESMNAPLAVSSQSDIYENVLEKAMNLSKSFCYLNFSSALDILLCIIMYSVLEKGPH